ncbi:hypothetical protein ABVT39_006855, partial [Epinephelus coioides]
FRKSHSTDSYAGIGSSGFSKNEYHRVFFIMESKARCEKVSEEQRSESCPNEWKQMDRYNRNFAKSESLHFLLDSTMSFFWEEKCFPQVLQGSYRGAERCQNKLGCKKEEKVNQRMFCGRRLRRHFFGSNNLGIRTEDITFSIVLEVNTFKPEIRSVEETCASVASVASDVSDVEIIESN